MGRLKAIAGLMIMSLFLSSAFSSAGAATFKFRLLAEPTTFDWNLASTSVETPLMMNLMEGLMEIDDNLKPKTCLAEKVEISKDQKTYTFTIRKNVKWSDGVPLKAQDFYEGWKRLLTPGTAAPYAYLIFDVVGAEDFNKKTLTDFSKVGISVKDDQTFVVTLRKPVAYFQYLVAFWALFPVRKDLIDKEPTTWSKPGKLVTLGPYLLDQYLMQNKIILKANPYYWRKMGNVTEVVAQIIKDSATAFNVFKHGGIQMMQDISPNDLKIARPMVEFKAYPYLKTNYLAFRVNGTVAENKYLRLAIGSAINRKPIPSILNGTEKVASSFIPPKIVGYDAHMELPYDVAKAKEYLAKSGLKPEEIKLKLILRNSERPAIMAQYIQSELKKNLGIDLQIELFDHKVFRTQITSTQSNYPMMLMVWSGDYPDGDSFMQLFESNTGNNLTHFTNAKVDEDITKAREDWNTLKREVLYREAQHIVQVDEAAVVPLYYEDNEALVARSVKGFVINPIGYFFFKDVSM